MKVVFHKFEPKLLVLILLLIQSCYSDEISVPLTDCDKLKFIVDSYPDLSNNWGKYSMDCCDNFRYICDANKQNIIQVNLSLNHLNGTISRNFAKLEKLESLDLHNNKISGTIPDEFSNLKNLKYLDLSSNNLKGKFPNVLTNLTSLVNLNLNYNEFSGNLPDGLNNLKNLESFTIRYNYISGKLNNLFTSNTKLKILDLSLNDIQGRIPESLGTLPELLEIHLNNNNLEGNLPITLTNLRNLKIFYISDNPLKGSVPELAKSLKLCSYKNTDLCIYDNAVCGKGTPLCTKTSTVFKYIISIVLIMIVITLIGYYLRKIILKIKQKREVNKDERLLNPDEDDDIIELNSATMDKQDPIEIDEDDDFIYSPSQFKSI